MDNVLKLSIKKLSENEDDPGNMDQSSSSSSSSPPSTTATLTTLENADVLHGGDDNMSGSDNGVGRDIINDKSAPSVSTLENSSISKAETKRESSNLQGDGKMSLAQYGGVDNTPTDKLQMGDGSSKVMTSGGGGGCGGGVDNPSFDPSPESSRTGDTHNPTHQQRTETTNRERDPDDKDSQKAFLYPSLGNGLKKGTAYDALDDEDDVTGYDKENDGVPCGIGGCHPDFMQRFRSIGWFSIAYGLTGVTTSALASYISSQITTLEKHFNFNSSVSGFLMSCNDIGYFLTCLFLSYLTRRIHIPRCLALATVLYGFSGLMCVVPYFGTRNTLLIDSMSSSNVSTHEAPGQMCVPVNPLDNNTANNKCHGATDDSSSGGGIHGVTENWRNLAITLIGLGMLVQGIAKSPRGSFVSVYIDDNGPKTKSSFYLGIISGMAIFGPSLAFILGGVFSSVYITLEDTEMSKKDPRWLGAWWLGFMLFGATSLVIGIPLLFFPKKMVSKPEIEMAERKRKMKGEGQNKLLVELKGFFVALLKLILNPLYMLLVVGSGLNYMAVSGMMSFIPKYLEVHFMVPTSTANIVLGAMTVGGASIGSVTGGVLISRYRFTPTKCLKFVIGVLTFGLVLHIALFLIKCDQPDIRKESGSALGNGSICTTSCRCNEIAFFPTCGDDGNSYYSPCHAGCTGLADGGTFTNCSCLATPHITTAKGGLCDTGCGIKFWIYVAITFFGSLCLALSLMPTFVTVVRSVPEDQKPMALGISSFLATLLGWFPGPIVFGIIVDSTCLITQSSPCSQEINHSGACVLYDLGALRNKYHGAVAILRVACLIFYSIALVLVRCSSKELFTEHVEDHEKNVDNKEKDGDNKNKASVGNADGGGGKKTNGMLMSTKIVKSGVSDSSRKK